MKTLIRTRIAVQSLMFAGGLLVGCSNLVPIPPSATMDSPPLIEINNFVVGGKGDVDAPKSLSSMTVNCQANTDLLLTGAAKSPGGVKDFSITVSQSGVTRYTASVIASQDASGRAPNLLSILTGDPGGAGQNNMKVTVGTNVTLKAVAHNFNGQETAITVVYRVPPPPPDKPKITLKAKPNDGYVNLGDWVTLTWDIASSVPFTANLSSNPSGVLSAKNLAPHGSLNFQPKGVVYVTVTAQNAGGTEDSLPKLVSVYVPPSGVQGQWFYFKMTGSSTVTSCFMQAVLAPDAAKAKQLAESKNGGYLATQINYQEFVNGCP
jgi:hypothetical protein